MNEVRVTNYIVRYPNSKVTDISHHTDIPLSTVSRAVKKLLRGGFITQTVDEDDGRAMLVTVANKRELKDHITTLLQFFDS